MRRNYLNRDATSVMRDLVTDAMGSDDPCKVVSFMVDESSGLWITKDIEPAVRMLSDEVGDLEDVGLGWTFSAGRLIVGPLASQHVTNTLTDQHMEADIAVEKDGAECVTDMLIQGKGVYGYHIDSERYVGLLQEVEKADSLVRAGECESLAKRRVEEAKYPPRRLDIGGDARLLPTAPISLDQLVPGALVPVSSSQTGITVSAVMMIKSISVTQDEGGDNVSLTLMEQPSALAPELMPQMVEADYNSPYDKDKREKEQTMPRDDSEMGYEDSEAIQPPLT